jgi:probable HAF family extracellular repeat protein
MSRRLISSALLSIVVGAIFCISSRDVKTQSGTPAYGVTDLGTLWGVGSLAVAVSPGAFPSIQGYIQDGTGGGRAFSGNVAGGIHDLGTLGGTSSQARGSYFGDAVIGTAQLPSGAFHAFVQDGFFPNFSLRDLGTLGGSQSAANGVTLVSTGPTTFTYVIVGESTTAGDAATRAFVYDTSTGKMSDLGATLGGPSTSAAAINSSQHVVGWADLGGSQPHHAFLFQNGVTTDLGTLGDWSEALAISDNDVIVGGSKLGASSALPEHAFRYQNGVMQDLGTLPGGNNSRAFGVNAAGTIVGRSEASGFGGGHAFVWRDGVMTDLNTLIPSGTGWELQTAAAIGNGTPGQEIIVGWGRFHNQTHAFVLTPPIDLSLNVHPPHENNLDTNIPNPHEAGQLLTVGPTVWNRTAFAATNVTVTDTFGGPVEIVNWSGADSCTQNGQQLTCTFKTIDGAFGARDLMINVRSTGAGVFTHSGTIVSADQPDPNTANNSDSESNTAVSLLSLVPATNTIQGGQPVLNRATITSTAPSGGATVHLTSSNPAIASVPSQFDVLRGCCDNGTWREFYVTTQPVSAPVTVQISATYGLVTQTVPLTITPASGSGPGPFGGSPRPVPGTIPAEVFDEGGEGVAYHDTSAGNNGGQFRNTDVDIETASIGGFDVGWTDPGEWLNYTVNVQTAGDYVVTLNVASIGGATMHVGFNGPSAGQWKTVTVPATGGWQNWTTVSMPVTLGAGTQQMTLYFDTGAMNLHDTAVASASSGTLSPFSGTPVPIPGTIDSEKFDNGGEGVAYHDDTAGNNGGQFRNTDVDIEAASEGGFDVGWIDEGEWLNYTINVTQAGNYTVQLRVASIPGATFHVGFNGPSTGQWIAVSVPATGGWQNWTTISVPVTLGAGTQQMTLFFDTGGMNFRQATVGP